MKLKTLLVILSLILSLNCKKDTEVDSIPCNETEKCSDAFNKLISATSYKGTLFLCNAQPPEMDFLEATAFVDSISTNEVSVRIITDSMFLDTILYYKIHCSVSQECLAGHVDFYDMDIYKGYYNALVGSVYFGFGYQNCLENTSFQGMEN